MLKKNRKDNSSLENSNVSEKTAEKEKTPDNGNEETIDMRTYGERLKQETVQKLKIMSGHIIILIKWIFIAAVAGVAVGGFSTLFGHAMNYVTQFRQENGFILYLLPLGGVFIVALYRLCDFEKDKGTNTVISNLHAHDDIPLRQAPLIFISTVVTHLCGGSAGREGAALQMGGSLGNGIGKLLRLDENDRRMTVMCGMSAAFSALFGTPMAAAVFSIEVGSVGIMYYSALVPCVFAAVIASQFAVNMGIRPESFHIELVPEMNVPNTLKIILLCVICAFVSCVFCIVLHQTGKLLKKLFKNGYVRIVAASLVIIAVAKLLRTTDYMGAGIDVIERAMEGDVVPYAFIMKIILTAVTLGAGFKGGEIVPSFFIGATLGCTLGNLFGISPSFCAALGMTAVFCGATNCPLTSLLISFELFGYKGVLFFMMAVAISFMMSGYYGLYAEQRIMYSKTKTQFINKTTH